MTNDADDEDAPAKGEDDADEAVAEAEDAHADGAVQVVCSPKISKQAEEGLVEYA